MSMDTPEELAGLDGHGRRVVIVAARFNAHFVDRLLEAARERLLALGVAQDAIEVVRVPGAFELPLVARRAARRVDVDGVIALGVVIRGGTPHFDYVCLGATTGLEAAARETDTPIAFGVLTTDTDEQAAQRCGGRHGNKGRDMADALIETLTALDLASATP